MATFLVESNLSKKIQEIAKGADLRCAVAFLGDNRKVLNLPKSARIICDIWMGGTSAEALKSFGAPTNENLKHFRNLHAKIYLSNLGLVTSSANATLNGIGSLGHRPQLREAGTYHTASSQAWHDASEWFDELFQRAEPICDNELQLAEQRHSFNRHYEHPEIQLSGPLSWIMNYPDHFEKNGVGFNLCNSTTTDEERKEAVDEASHASENPRKAKAYFLNFPKDRTFTGWKADIPKLPSRFIGFFIGPKTGKYVKQHECKHKFSNVFYTEKPSIRITTPINNVSFPSTLTDKEWTRVQWVLTKYLEEDQSDPPRRGGVQLTAREFAEWLRRSYEEMQPE